MNEELNVLVTALREELAQYGEMLALLDQEQEQVITRGTQELLDTVACINQQSDLIRKARDHRGECQRVVAGLLNLNDAATFEDLRTALPANYCILITELVNENNELLQRVQSRARQNHVLLTRSLELMQKLIGTLFPTGRSTTYGGKGTVQRGALPQRALYEGVG